MKKIILSSIVLLIFSISIAVFQVSCQKDATANTDSNSITGITQQNKIIYVRQNESKLESEIWSANYDGSNQKKLVTADYSPYNVNVSPDGQSIFFAGSDSSYKRFIYTCKVDGSNITKIIGASENDPIDYVDIVAY